MVGNGESERERADAELTDQIREIHTELRGDPGVRRVWSELVVRGCRVARKRVWRLMKAAGLRGRHPRAWKKTTVAGQWPVDAPDLIGQDFTADQPNTRWCGDITYVRTVEGWVYTAMVIDLYSRKVVGYAVADHLRSSLIMEALAAALLTRSPRSGSFSTATAVASTPHEDSLISVRLTGCAVRWADAPPVSITRSPNLSSRSTRKNSSTPALGATSPMSASTHSSGSSATTTVSGGTQP